MGVDYHVIGSRIKARRRSLGRTQDNLAEALSVSVGYVSQLERGVAKINLDTLSAVSGWLGCSMAELLTGADAGREDYLSGEISLLSERMDEKQKRLFLEIGESILKHFS